MEWPWSSAAQRRQAKELFAEHLRRRCRSFRRRCRTRAARLLPQEHCSRGPAPLSTGRSWVKAMTGPEGRAEAVRHRVEQAPRARAALGTEGGPRCRHPLSTACRWPRTHGPAGGPDRRLGRGRRRLSAPARALIRADPRGRGSSASSPAPRDPGAPRRFAWRTWRPWRIPAFWRTLWTWPSSPGWPAGTASVLCLTPSSTDGGRSPSQAATPRRSFWPNCSGLRAPLPGSLARRGLNRIDDVQEGSETEKFAVDQVGGRARDAGGAVGPVLSASTLSRGSSCPCTR